MTCFWYLESLQVALEHEVITEKLEKIESEKETLADDARRVAERDFYHSIQRQFKELVKAPECAIGKNVDEAISFIKTQFPDFITEKIEVGMNVRGEYRINRVRLYHQNNLLLAMTQE